jgi:hypothetical protein
MATTTPISSSPIDCACVIHGDAYSWQYVDRLYSMLNHHITPGIRLHVYTEANRSVPAPMIKHELTEWTITRRNRGWWYKLQLFNPVHHAGPLLYFDLDVVITGNLDWIWQRSPTHFWAVKDFKYLWRSTSVGLNSSVMWWDTRHYGHVWDSFSTLNLEKIMSIYHGDQDYISSVIPQDQLRFFDTNRVLSWRWQCLDGGYNFQKKCHLSPGTGTQFTANASILVFHGNPKPSEVQDPVILQYWQ